MKILSFLNLVHQYPLTTLKSSMSLSTLKKELAMVIGLTTLGFMLGKSDANNTKGVVSSIAASLAGFVGYKAFYKPIKIDISGKTYD